MTLQARDERFGDMLEQEVAAPAAAAEPSLSAATLAAIAELSAGDPRRADRLTRLALGMAPEDAADDAPSEPQHPPFLIAPPPEAAPCPAWRYRLGRYALVGLVAAVGLAADGIALRQAAFGPPAAASTAAQPADADTPLLLARGDAFLQRGDIASARLFYERAAHAGSSEAALRLGNTFDPSFLARAGAHGVPADPGLARRWYRRARELQSH
jgi:hypothetical protein